MPLAYVMRDDWIESELARIGGDRSRFDFARVLSLEDVPTPRVGCGQLRVRVCAVSIEHNILHAALAQPVNIVRLRGGRVCPGNTFVGEVIEVGEGVTRFKPQDVVMCGGTPTNDRFGYPLRVPGYDSPDVDGCFAEEIAVDEGAVRLAPTECGLSLFELVATPLRAWTANHLWRRGEAIYRAKVAREKQAVLNVLAFGGGTSEFFLMLAQSEGHRVFYCSGSAERRAAMEERGIQTIDQLEFGRFAEKRDRARFTRRVRQLTDGEGMHVVCDMFRGPVFEAGLAATARQGVNVSAGWQLDDRVSYSSPGLTLKQITLDHVHFETVEGCDSALELFGSVFVPHLHHEIYSFEDVPRALAEMHANTQTGLPVARVAVPLSGRLADLDRASPEPGGAS